MKSYFAALIFVISFILIAGCQKKPKADFTTDKQVYKQGEMITITNTSTNAKNYKLTVNGEFYDIIPGTIQVPTPVPGEYSINLAAFSKNAKKTDVTIKTVNVIP